ncbi:MAG TPA: flagellar hook protein FlgE [Caulobacteraceae bacterium]|nr:flagellar hook protein FlgE [Caulobacteraceae bacterium]
MSGINNAMLAGVSGLSANSAALASISDDIANVNTVGYKANNVQFSDMVTNTAGVSYPSGGVQAVNTQEVTVQGVMQSASAPTDLGISGNGFFVTSQGASAISGTNTALYTRAGAFTENAQGYLVNSAGLFLQGWPANASGTVATNPSSLASLSPINLSQIISTPVPTTTAGIVGNVDSAQAVSAGAATYAAGGMAAGTTTPDFTMQIPVSDSEGGSQTLQIDMLKTGANTWAAEVVSNPASATTGTHGLIASGTITFNSDGTLNTASPALTSLAVNWSPSMGIANQTISLNLNTLTQDNSTSTLTNVQANGTPTGSLTSVQVSSTGVVSAVFSNGTSRTIAQVALATFPDPDGLTAVNGDAYQASQASGNFTLQVPGSGGSGNIESSNLESSTVDLSAEFTNMITTQRAYSASSKIITTADSMLQDLISIIR